MDKNFIQKLEDAFSPMIGKLAWSVRRGHGTFLTMEFGAPHLSVREPVSASPEASLKVRRNLAKRRVSIVGDWHFWVKYAQWEIRTVSCSMRSEDALIAAREEVLSELEGQILLSATAGAAPNSCVLQFDLGASLYVWPSPEIDDDQWSVHAIGGTIISCDREGNVITEGPSNRGPTSKS